MNIAIIGGDKRIIELTKVLSENGATIGCFALERCEELTEYKHFQNINDAIEFAEEIITSIPISKDGKLIYAPFSTQKIEIKEIFNIAKNKKIITGNITEDIKKIININNNNEIIDILKHEELIILNAIPTAEGAIQIAMEKSLKTLHGSNCLVMGFGRIGKILSKMLKGIGANVYCEARKNADLAWINAYGLNSIELNNLNNYLEKFDFIFNTIPFVILDEGNLNLVKKDCLLIDLASKPGGINFEAANKLKLQTEWALALPGKVAPKTAANYIYKVIKNM